MQCAIKLADKFSFATIYRKGRADHVRKTTRVRIPSDFGKKPPAIDVFAQFQVYRSTLVLKKTPNLGRQTASDVK